MGMPVVATATATCSFGVAPSTLVFLPTPMVLVGGKPVGTITDSAPAVNIPPFGMCQSLANPTVAAATSAALGVLTPMPCVPVTPAPWVPGAPTVLVGGKPVLNDSSKCMCTWGGVIGITFGGAPTVQVP